MYNPIPYSDEYAKFCRLRYATRRELFENLPIFFHENNGIKTAELPFSNYYLELNKSIDASKLSKKLFDRFHVDVVKMNLLNHLGPSTFVALLLDLSGYTNTNDLLVGGVTLRKRNQIKLAYEQGYTTKIISHKLLDEFYQLYVTHHRQRGYLVREITEIENIVKAFGTNAFILGAYREDTLISAILFVVNGPYLWMIINASDYEGQHAQMNNYMYWEVIRYAFAHDIKMVDFGGTPLADAGNIQFKRGFGVTAVPIYSGLFFLNFKIRIQYWLGRKWWHLKLRFR